MNCLCCGKPLKKATESGWHKTCVKKFFGVPVVPNITIDEETLKELAKEDTERGLTVPGVQKKLSLNIHLTEINARLTLVNYPTGYILKPQVEEFDCLPEAEQMAMSMADETGIQTVPHALLRSGDNVAYITKRVDRVLDGETVKKLAMEDFCQLDLRLTQDKYKGSYERCAKIIRTYSAQPGFDIAELFMRLVFSFVIGNSDMHLKNFSLIEKDYESGIYTLAPAYDLLPVNLVLPEDKEEFALTMNGKKSKIRRKDFFDFAKACNVPDRAVEKMLAKICSLKPKYRTMCEESLMSQEMKERFLDLMENRFAILEA